MNLNDAIDRMFPFALVLAGIALFVGGLVIGTVWPGIVWFIVGPL